MSAHAFDTVAQQPPDRRSEARERVAILGAGPAGLAAAMALTESGQYSVHVYQMGSRAGGKSGTARAPGSLRAEQNGSHYLFGCYENAFVLLRKAHAILRESVADATCFGDYEHDLLPINLLVSKQLYGHTEETGNGDWFRYIPQNMAFPGDGRKFPTAFDYLLMLVQVWLAIVIDAFVALFSPTWREDRFAGVRVCLWLFPICPLETRLRARATRAALTPLRWAVNASWALLRLLWAATSSVVSFLAPNALLQALKRAWNRAWPLALDALRGIVHHLHGVSLVLPVELSRQLQRRLILVDFGVTLLVGFLVDGLYQPGGFAKIDRYDFREWLLRHGARPETSQCAMVRTWYDAIVSYEDGDPAKPRCSAALAIHSLLRALLTYKGAFAYQLRAEVGDSFIAPIVRALELRGVRFHFYERVQKIVVDRDRGLVTRVQLAVQRDAESSQAEFIDVLDNQTNRLRKAWPLERGSAGDNGELPFDSYYCDRAIRERQLKLRNGHTGPDDGDYFDSIVSALPMHVLEDVLVDSEGQSPALRSAYWNECFRGVKFVESQALRIWFGVTLRELGWTDPSLIVSGYHPPHSTWEDDSRASHTHAFPEPHHPKAIATLFGPLPTGPEDTRSVRHLRRQQEAARAAAESFVDNHMLPLWPGLRTPDGGTNWNAFIDLDGGLERDRLRWQHVVANVGPNENYVLCLPGTLRHRLRPDESGFRNLFLAGDWTRNGVEVGTIEGAVVSGYKAAKTLSGWPQTIIGENDIECGDVFARPV
jgi:uncharacterized protein with NAD-binding domain and iron-sulfur cluster